MQRQSTRQLTIMLLLGLCLALFAMSVPLTAQGTLFVTNTPAGSSSSSGNPLFATNTPPPAATATPLPTVTPGPAASLFNYSLKTWLETELVDLAFHQIERLRDGVTDANLALQVTLYELERRFPGAPRNEAQRIQMIDAMLQAPVASIDMRSIVRPYIENVVNAQPDATTLDANGFQIMLQPANLDNRGTTDALVQILYTRSSDGVVLYNDYVLAIRNANNSLEFLDETHDLTAAPFGGIQAITLEQISDVNRDAVDEVVLRVDDGDVNSRLYILAFRNGVTVELTQPGDEIRFGEMLSWDVASANPVLHVLQLQTESAAPNWSCASAQPLNWTYERNFYRSSTEINSRFEHVDSLGCTLYEAEPLFALPPADAIGMVESALLDYGFDAESADRALMTLAMLYVLQGRLADAQTTAQSIIPADDPNSWAARQGNALLAATGISSNTALDICQALALASQDPACDMNAVVGRYLEALELSTDTDLVEQLEAVGLPVAEAVTRSEIGKADRIVVSFLLANTEWWGFAEQRDGTYLAEPALAPEGFDAAIFPQAQVKVPQAAYDALFVANDPISLLAILSNVESENPDVPFRPDGMYLRALAYDLTASREEARVAYYEVWNRYPDTIWGQLASEHLVLR
jgi:hypothetical protein